MIKNNSKKEFKWDIGVFDPVGSNPNPLTSNSYSDIYKNLAKFWSGLPAYSMGKQIVKTIESNDIILIKSATGSGKSLLINKFCLHVNDYQGKIIMTLPKKIITKKAAEFSAKTLDVVLGEQVGYQFRGDSLKSNKTVLLYSTDGSIISMIKSDPMLKQIDMVIIDEAHERKVNIDLLLYLLKNSIKLRREKKIKPLKLIIMSATINESIFQSYYSDFKFDWMELSGTPNHPIQSIYLESSLDIKSSQYIEKGKEIIGQIIKKIKLKQDNFIQGDILFFVCTISECNTVAEELGKLYPDCFTMGLYSGFDPELEQYISNSDKYKELNPNFKRRLFVSTNVAESSLTIDGIVYVIDSGLELSVKFDPQTNTNIMKKDLVTQAQMTQRKGRAGRTKPGQCYHLYTVSQQETVLKFPEPEIKCIDLKNTCISLLKMCSDINPENNQESGKKIYCNVSKTIEMFTHFIEPPGEKFITNGFEFAYSNSLIDSSDNTLSKIGRLVVESRLDVMDGLAMLYAYNISNTIFKAVFKIITICSFLKSGSDDLFYKDIENSVKSNIINKLLPKSENSEHLFLYNLYKHIETNKNQGIFNMELFNTIESTYSRQIEKLDLIYSRFNYILKDIKKTDSKSNSNSNSKQGLDIINSFGYGYKSNRAFKSAQGYKYNDKLVDLSKCVVKSKLTSPSIFFYTNLSWFGKLNLMICSPYLL